MPDLAPISISSIADSDNPQGQIDSIVRQLNEWGKLISLESHVGDVGDGSLTLTNNQLLLTKPSGTQVIIVGRQDDNETFEAINAGSIEADSITSDNIAAGAITSDELLSESVIAGKIAAGAVTAGTIAAGVVTADEIESGTITGDLIAGDAITAVHLSAGSVEADTLAANSVIAGKVAAGTITGEEIDAATITGANIAAGTLTADNIEAGSITGTEIAVDTITADNISALDLTGKTITADTGTIGGFTLGENELIGPDGSSIHSADMTDFGVGTGYWLDSESGTGRYFFGQAGGDSTSFDGTDVRYTGKFAATSVINVFTYTTATLPVPPTASSVLSPSGTA